MVTVGSFPAVLSVDAEEDYSNSEHWQSLCMDNNSMDADEIKSCRAYAMYLQTENEKLQDEIYDLADSKEDLNENISEYTGKIDAYDRQLSDISDMVQDLNTQLKAAENRRGEIQKVIKETQEQIDAQTDEVNALKEKMANRVENQQETMRLNQYLDILMGAKTLSDLMRIANGLNDIYAYDSRTMEELNKAIVALNQSKSKQLRDESELNTLESDLSKGKQALDDQQKELESSQSDLQKLQDSYRYQLSETDLKIVNIQTDVTANNRVIDNINAAISASLAALRTPTPEPQPGNTTDPTPEPTYTEPVVSSTGVNPYYGGWGNCTWGCWQLVYDTLGIALPGWGMAGAWIQYAQRDGYATGYVPAVYSIAVYEGHVAFVTEIGDGQIYIKEGNYMGHYCERWVPLDALPWTGQRCLGYIYLY